MIEYVRKAVAWVLRDRAGAAVDSAKRAVIRNPSSWWICLR